jgi:uncharacterized protein YukE
MGTKIVVDTQNLISTSKKIQEIADGYKKTAMQIMDEVQHMSSSWSGKDNVAYVNQIMGFKDDFDKLDNLLRQYALMLITVEKEYLKTVQDSYSIANSL